MMLRYGRGWDDGCMDVDCDGYGMGVMSILCMWRLSTTCYNLTFHSLSPTYPLLPTPSPPYYQAHKARIMGEHVADYMREMEEDDEENYRKHFSKYLEAEIEADDFEELFEKVLG